MSLVLIYSYKVGLGIEFTYHITLLRTKRSFYRTPWRKLLKFYWCFSLQNRINFTNKPLCTVYIPFRSQGPCPLTHFAFFIMLSWGKNYCCLETKFLKSVHRTQYMNMSFLHSCQWHFLWQIKERHVLSSFRNK